MITAKTILNSKLESGVGDNRQIVATFGADYGTGKNSDWAQFTPSLQLSMTLKGGVGDKFEVGKSYTLQFVAEDELAEEAPSGS